MLNKVQRKKFQVMGKFDVVKRNSLRTITLSLAVYCIIYDYYLFPVLCFRNFLYIIKSMFSMSDHANAKQQRQIP